MNRVAAQSCHTSHRRRNAGRSILLAAGLAICGSASIPGPAAAANYGAFSPPAMLDYFGGGWVNITNRMPDVFGAGYGSLLTPPPTRADSGNSSVGYDIYNRFDLGSANNPTAYGTLQGYENLIAATHQMGGYFYTDYSMGHNGFSNSATAGFVQAGAYPGMVVQTPTAVDGDFNSAYASNTEEARLAGLINIDFTTNNQYIRNPTTAGNTANIPAGTTPAFGRLANDPMPMNQQFYPQLNNNPIFVYNPLTGQGNIQINSFNTANAAAGSPTTENVTGYMMRNLQWFVQSLGVDGFRLDAVKNMEWQVALPYFDQAVYRASSRTYLNGVQEPISAFSEYYDSNIPGASNAFQDSTVQVIQKSGLNADGSLVDYGNNGTVQPNRDALDFPLFFAMQSNLTGNGYTNNWYNVVNAALDSYDATPHDGLIGVKFVQSQDNGAPYLSNVAYAYTLMMPGQAIVYYNGNTTAFDNGTQSFPQNGRGDALGGVYGNALANNSQNIYNPASGTMTETLDNQVSGLVDLRNRFAYGNYVQRYLSQNNFAFERSDSALVLLNNQTGGGNLNATLQTNFNAYNVPYLVEVTGNAAKNGLPQVLTVNSDSTVNVTFPNNNSNGQGYLIYAPPTPIGTLTLTNVAGQMGGNAPAANDPNITFDNGNNTVSTIAVIKAAQFQVNLQTQKVYLLGNSSLFDYNAGGDNAILKIDGGVQLNGQTFVSTVPNTTAYGYIPFESSSPLVGGGTGLYSETINTADISQGYHYLEAIAFRARPGGGPPVYTDWTQTIYVDTSAPVSGIQSFNPITPGVNQNRSLVVKSVDGLANNIHVLWDLPAADTNAQVLAMVGNANQASQSDTNLWVINETGLTSGNHVATVVTYKPDGTYNIQRFAGLYTSTIYGAGLGDLNFDGQYNVADVQAFSSLMASNNSLFNPAADFDHDGLIGRSDLLDFGAKLASVGASSQTMQAYDALLAQYPATSLSVAVPEPAAIGILLLGLVPLVLPGRSKFRRTV